MTRGLVLLLVFALAACGSGRHKRTADAVADCLRGAGWTVARVSPNNVTASRNGTTWALDIDLTGRSRGGWTSYHLPSRKELATLARCTRP